MTRLYLYYDMKLVTFGVDNQRNLIIQIPVFVQTYTQKRLTMYQIETVPVPILDENEQVQLYTQLKIEKPYIALNTVLYNLLLINWYISSITKNVIAKFINRFGISHGYFIRFSRNF